ncbi:MAG: cytochrome c oxidase subunit II [Solirubrobacteraceae bacterium]
MNRERGRDEKTPVLWMVVHGLIASAVGIAAGLAIHWFPEQASTQAGPIDNLYDVLIWTSVPVFVTVTIIVLFSVRNFKMRPGEEQLDGPPIHGNTRLEVIWTAIPAIVLVVLCSYAWVVLNDIEEAQAGEMRVNVTGQQFAWTFEYPQADGKPVKSTQLVLANDQPVRFYVKALDVLHDFWVPAFRMKVDAVPGITTKYRVTPNRLGTYPVVCAELCGLGHSVMRATARVVPQADFDAWIAELKAPAAKTAGGAIDGKKLFTDGNGAATACGACHTLADAGTSATTGPDLDKVLVGKDAPFIQTAIVKPDAEITAGFQAGIMPRNYADTLSADELKALVKYVGEVAAK